jgi:hypothetical protein
MEIIDLDKYLSKFYAEVRTKDGSVYSKNGLLTLRYGLQNRFAEIKVDIINDKLFQSSGQTFAAVFVHMKRIGKESVLHKEPLTEEDFKKLYAS